MKITTVWNDVTTKGVNIGVRITRERPEKAEDGTDPIGDMIADVYDTMEIVSILKAIKESNENAFNKAMERFIEEELAEAGEESDDE